MSAHVVYNILWCTSEQELKKKVESLEQALAPRVSNSFASDKDFTHWLFRQARGPVTPDSVLVVGWREAKQCMAAIKAARTGDMAGLRPDRTRPQLAALSPGRPASVEVVVAAMVVVVTKRKQYDRASEWLKSEERDQFVQAGVVRGCEDIKTSLAPFFPPRRVARATAAAPSRVPPREPSVSARDGTASGLARGDAVSSTALPLRGRSREVMDFCSSSRARTPSPDYMWPGFSSSAPERIPAGLPALVGASASWSLGHGRAIGLGGASTAPSACTQEPCCSRARTPSPDHTWHGFPRAWAPSSNDGSPSPGKVERPCASWAFESEECETQVIPRMRAPSSGPGLGKAETSCASWASESEECETDFMFALAI